jgi:hypothetical protein
MSNQDSEVLVNGDTKNSFDKLAWGAAAIGRIINRNPRQTTTY